MARQSPPNCWIAIRCITIFSIDREIESVEKLWCQFLISKMKDHWDTHHKQHEETSRMAFIRAAFVSKIFFEIGKFRKYWQTLTFLTLANAMFRKKLRHKRSYYALRAKNWRLSTQRCLRLAEVITSRYIRMFFDTALTHREFESGKIALIVLWRWWQKNSCLEQETARTLSKKS